MKYYKYNKSKIELSIQDFETGKVTTKIVDRPPGDVYYAYDKDKNQWWVRNIHWDEWMKISYEPNSKTEIKESEVFVGLL